MFHKTHGIYLATLLSSFLVSADETPLVDPPRIRCLNKWEDLTSNNWFQEPDLQFASNALELPEALRHLGDGDEGIFYYNGEDIGLGRGLHLYPKDSPRNSSSPVFLYIKYYHHDPKNWAGNIAGYISPILGSVEWDSEIQILDRTTDYLWKEAIAELQPGSPYWFQTVSTNLRAENYFLFDKAIVTEGYQISSIEDMLELCSTGGENPICKEEGTFPDPANCAQFHVCTPDGNGGLTDNVLTCPDTTVWCQRAGRCEFEKDCPCSNTAIRESSKKGFVRDMAVQPLKMI